MKGAGETVPRGYYGKIPEITDGQRAAVTRMAQRRAGDALNRVLDILFAEPTPIEDTVEYRRVLENRRERRRKK